MSLHCGDNEDHDDDDDGQQRGARVGGPVRVVGGGREDGAALPGVGDLALVAGGEGRGVFEDVFHDHHLVDVPQVHAGPVKRRRLVKGAVQAGDGGCYPFADVAVERHRIVKGAAHLGDGGRDPFADVAVERRRPVEGGAQAYDGGRDPFADVAVERRRTVKGAVQARDGGRDPFADVAVERRRLAKGAAQALDGGRDPFADVAVERLGFGVAGVAVVFARLVAVLGKGVREGRDAARIPVLDGAPLGDRSRRGVDDFPRRRVELALGEGLFQGVVVGEGGDGAGTRG